MSSQSSSSTVKPADYVYFERTTAGFSEDALPRSKAAQLKLEHYYKVAVEAAIERNQRYVRPTRSLIYFYHASFAHLRACFRGY